MPGKFYMLVNPYVHHKNISNVVKANNSIEAAKKAYENISTFFTNEVSNYKFSLLKLKSDNVHDTNNILLSKYGDDAHLYNNENFSHFVVNEKRNKKNKEVQFTIESYKGKVDDKMVIIDNINNIQKDMNKFLKNNQEGSGSDNDDDENEKDINKNEESSETSSADSVLSGGKNYKKKHRKKHKKKYRKYDDDDDSSSSSSSSSDSPNYISKSNLKYIPNRKDPYWWYAPNYYIDDNLYMIPPNVPFAIQMELNRQLLAYQNPYLQGILGKAEAEVVI